MRRMLHVTILAAAVLGLLCAAPSTASAQKTQQVFIKLTGADGTAVTDLQASDVKVMEDGVECKVLKFEPADWPTRLQILLDNGPVNTTPINSLREGLKAFYEKLPDGIEVTVYLTAPAPRPLIKASTDRQKLIASIDVIAPDRGAGAFFESMYEALSRIDKDKTPSFPVILIIGSDVGAEIIRDNDIPDVQKKAFKNAVTIHAIVSTGGSSGSSRSGAQPEIAGTMTRQTGGRYEYINTTTRLATLLPEFAERIAAAAIRQRNQYRITYESARKGNATPQLSFSVTRPGTISSSTTGRVP